MPTYGCHVKNTYDHRLSDAKDQLTLATRTLVVQDKEAQWQHHLDFIARHVIGPPRKTNQCTVQELEAMNMIGLYEKP